MSRDMFRSSNDIAKELNLSKQRVYRFIKRENITESYRDKGVMYYDESVYNLVYNEFKTKNNDKEVHHDVYPDALIDTLMKQLDVKDKQIQNKDLQIEDLSKLLDQQQQLLLLTSKQKEMIELELNEKKEKKRRSWRKYFSKVESKQP